MDRSVDVFDVPESDGSDRGDGTGPGRVLFTDPQRFPLLALSGRATAFVWNADGLPMRPIVDAARLAFAPQAASHIAPPSDEEPSAQTAWERYVSGIRPRSTQLEEAAAWHEFTDAAQMRVNEGMKAAAVASLVGGAGTDGSRSDQRAHQAGGGHYADPVVRGRYQFPVPRGRFPSWQLATATDS